jgi:hypothetical protein
LPSPTGSTSIRCSNLAVEIDYAEDHHDVLADHDAPVTVRTVMSIRSVQVRYVPAPKDHEATHIPVPGSAELTEVDRSNGDEMRSRNFRGYLVETLTSDGD